MLYKILEKKIKSAQEEKVQVELFIFQRTMLRTYLI